MDDDEPDRMMMLMLMMIEPITIKLIQSSTIRILFVFGRIIASIICIRPNSTDVLFGTALELTNEYFTRQIF